MHRKVNLGVTLWHSMEDQVCFMRNSLLCASNKDFIKWVIANVDDVTPAFISVGQVCCSLSPTCWQIVPSLTGGWWWHPALGPLWILDIAGLWWSYKGQQIICLHYSPIDLVSNNTVLCRAMSLSHCCTDLSCWPVKAVGVPASSSKHGLGDALLSLMEQQGLQISPVTKETGL